MRWLLDSFKLAAIIPADVLHRRWHLCGINRLPTSGNKTMAVQLLIHTMEQRRGPIFANAPNCVAIQQLGVVSENGK